MAASTAVVAARTALLASCAAAVVGAVVVLGGWRPVPWLDGNAAGLAAGAWAALCATWAAVVVRGRMRLAWSLLAALTWLYLGGDVLWLAFGGLDGHAPVLSLADSLYLAALVPAVLGLMAYPVTRGLRGTIGPVLLDAGVLGTAVLLLSEVLVFREVTSRATDATEAFMLLVYPVTDVMLACLVLLLLIRSVGEARLDVVLLGLAFGAYGVADNGYALLTVRGEDLAGTHVDYLYVVAPLLLAAAALTTQLVSTETRVLRRTVGGVWAPVLPDLVAVVVLGVCLMLWLHGTTSWVLAVALLGLTGARQVTVTSHAQRLRLELERRVTERTAELEELSERHERLERAKYSFVGAVSHELRTPLTAIRGSLEMLVDGDAGELPPPALRALTLATRGSERLARLVSNIIDLERLESGAFGFAPEAHELEELLVEAVDSLAGIAEQAGVEVVVEPTSATVWADADQLLQIMVNLVGNALKFAPAGTRVTVSTTVRPGQVEVAVRDRGRGIPADQLQAVFDRFHQVESSIDQEKGGAGLGLAITKRIVEAHGGTIWAESPPGRGACIRFTVPTPAVVASPVVAQVEPTPRLPAA